LIHVYKYQDVVLFLNALTSVAALR